MTSRLYRVVNPSFRLSGGRQGLATLRETMNAAEAAHALLFVMVSVIAIAALMLGWADSALWLTVFNIVLNAYPVMLQRYNRLRLVPLLRQES
jgi:hypothetical protein